MRSTKRKPHAESASRTARRAVWKGRISFGLVGIPVELVPAVDAREHLGFHLLHRKDLAPIRYRKFCSQEDVEVSDDEVVRGYEASKGKWAVVEKDELAAARTDAGAGTEAHTLEILSFLGTGRIDPLTFDQPYYLVPDEGGARPFAVFRNALAASDRVGLGRLRLRSREHLAAVIVIPHGLVAILLRPFEEVAAAPSAGSLSAGTGEIKMARLLIDQMSEEALDPAKYPDRYRSALKKLLAKKGAVAGTGRSRGPAGERGPCDRLDGGVARERGSPRGQISAQEARRIGGDRERHGRIYGSEEIFQTVRQEGGGESGARDA